MERSDWYCDEVFSLRSNKIDHMVPAGPVVVSGVLNRGRYGLNAAIIVKTVDEQTRSKTSITELLRGV